MIVRSCYSPNKLAAKRSLFGLVRRIGWILTNPVTPTVPGAMCTVPDRTKDRNRFHTVPEHAWDVLGTYYRCWVAPGSISWLLLLVNRAGDSRRSSRVERLVGTPNCYDGRPKYQSENSECPPAAPPRSSSLSGVASSRRAAEPRHRPLVPPGSRRESLMHS